MIEILLGLSSLIITDSRIVSRFPWIVEGQIEKIFATNAIAFFLRIGFYDFNSFNVPSIRTGPISTVTTFVRQLNMQDTSTSFDFIISYSLIYWLDWWKKSNFINVFGKVDCYLFKEIGCHKKTWTLWINWNGYRKTCHSSWSKWIAAETVHNRIVHRSQIYSFHPKLR